jgi:hypothetical protein
MIVLCPTCGRHYDDTYRWTYCPHDTFAANDGANNFRHHPESYLSRKKEDMVSPLFQVHMLNDVGKKRAADIAESFNNLLMALSGHCPDGREMAIVRTKLEEAAFFAKKSMANVPENQQ